MLGNDSGADGNVLTIESVWNPRNGSVSLDRVAETITFTPDSGFMGDARFDYTVSDGYYTNTATVLVAVEEPRSAPTAVGESAVGNEDTLLQFSFAELLANDTDAQGSNNNLTIISVGGSSNGTVFFDPVLETVSFIPVQDYHGPASFDYSVSDGLASSVATVSLEIQATADAPVPQADNLNTLQDQVLTIAFAELLANDADVDGDTISITGVSNAVNGSVVLDGLAQTIVFTPDAGYFGEATFEYTISDGTLNASASVTIDIEEVNLAPEGHDDSVTTRTNAAIVLSFTELLANDTDREGDTLTITSVASAVNGSVILDNANEQLIFTPDTDYTGPAAFDYVVSDGTGSDTATVSVDVQMPAGIAPDVAGETLYGQVGHANRFDFEELLFNDIDYDGDVASITDITTDGLGTLTLDFAAQQFTYLPAAGESTVNFDYTVSDTVFTSTANAVMHLHAGTVLTDGVDDADGGRGDDVISGLDGNDKLESKGDDDILIGGNGDDLLKGGGGDDIVIGGLGDDTLRGGKHKDQLFGGAGDDFLKGEKGDDTYYFDLGDGHDIINNNSKNFATDHDIIQFMDRVAPEDLWFSRKGNHLVIDVIGTDDQITIVKWYSAEKIPCR